MAVAVSDPEVQPRPAPPVSRGAARRGRISALILPMMLVVAWAFALSGSKPPGAVTGEADAMASLRWIIYFSGVVFVISSVMHSVFRRSMAASIGWKTNGFQLELAAASLGLGGACFYAVYHGIDAMVTVSLPIVTFLVLAGVNHIVEIVRKQNYAPNNTLILIWDFGVPISIVALLISIGTF